MFDAAAGRVAIDHSGRSGAAPATVVPRQRPEVSGFGFASSRGQHRRRGLVHEEAVPALQLIDHALDDRAEMEGGLADPAGQGRAVQFGARARQDLRLAIQRNVVGVSSDEDMGERRLGRQSAEAGPSDLPGS